MYSVNVGPDDADFVQVVHTDAFARGILSASGHIDFYMNGGILSSFIVDTHPRLNLN